MNLKNHFLIAMPQMKDPNFHRTVSYICEHNEEGAFAIIINRPLDLQLEYIFNMMDIKTDDEQTRTKQAPGNPKRPETIPQAGECFQSDLS